jgi:putative glutamine amidotransferase
MRPLIGITCSRVIGGAWGAYDRGHFMDYTFTEYSRAIADCGGASVLIPVVPDKAPISTVIERIDGLLLSGGPDVNPARYGDLPGDKLGEIDEDQDRMEMLATALAFEQDLPILAICRGIQLLNVARGGTLYQDISSEVPGSINHVQQAAKAVNTHRVAIGEKTRLRRIMGEDEIWVNGRHHQALRDPAPGLTVSGRAPDGIIEAVEAADRPFVIGVQWHPEGTFGSDPYSKKLFAAFVAAAGDR